MMGKIFITRYGYDPQLGRHVKDPYLGSIPTIGACRPDYRRQLNVGDYIFVISGKIKNANQFVMGGFEVAKKLNAYEAYHEYPEQRLHMKADGQLAGNIIVNEVGVQHELDDHNNFEERIKNYIVGREPIIIDRDEEIARCREETLPVLCEIFKKNGNLPIDVLGRGGRKVNETQIDKLRYWLSSLKKTH